jgi:queuosine precursor transporter
LGKRASAGDAAASLKGVAGGRRTVTRELERRRLVEGLVCLGLFTLTIPAANWLIGHVGVACPPPNGPCVVPVAPGVMAPSGVLMIGLALVLRDLVQRRLGAKVSLLSIAIGTLISAWLAPPAIVRASAAAFLLSELADFAVYTPLQRRRLVLAVALSSLAGLIVDSIVFLLLAFGSLDYLPGQVIGKAWMVLLALPVVRWLRGRDARLGLGPA